MPKSDAERSREYRQRKKENNTKIKKPPKSSTERVRDFRARRIKMLDKQNENNSYNVNNIMAGVPNSDKGRLFLHVEQEKGSDHDENTGAGQAVTQNFIEVNLPSRNEDGAGLIIPTVKQENDSDFDDDTEAGKAVTPNFIEVELPSRNEGDGTLLPHVKQENGSDCDDNTDDVLLNPIVKLEYESDADGNTGNGTNSVYKSSLAAPGPVNGPGPSTQRKLFMEIVDSKCVATYSRPSETESTDTETRRLKKVPKTAAERGREYRARKALLREQRRQQQERDAMDAQTIELKKLEKKQRSAEATRRWREKIRAMKGITKKQPKTAAERMREYRQRKKRARQSDQDSDAALSTSSSQVGQATGASTAELQQQSYLCTVCNRLCFKDGSQKASDSYEDLSKKITNINNINNAMICSACEVALDKQRHVHGQFGIYGDESTLYSDVNRENDGDCDVNTDDSLLIPVVKLEYESDADGNTGNDTDSVYENGAPGQSTKKRYSRQDLKPSETESTDTESRRKNKAPKTAAELAREYSERKALLNRQRINGLSEDNHVPKLCNIKIVDQRVISGSPEEKAKTVAERMEEYRQRKKRARKSDQDVDGIVSTSSSQVNQVAGPSTAELQQQNSYLCTVCNRLCFKDGSQKAYDNYEDRSKKITNINAINNAMICSACEVALDKQRHVHGQFGIYGDQGAILPEVKQVNGSDYDDDTDYEKMLASNAKKCRNYRNRKKEEAQKLRKKPAPKTAAERARLYRLRKKQLAQAMKFSMNETLSTPSTLDSQTLEPSPQPVTAEANQDLIKIVIEVELPNRNDGDKDTILPEVKQNNDTEYEANTDDSLFIPVVKLEYDSDADGNTESQTESMIEKEPGDHIPRTIEQSSSTNNEEVSYSVQKQANLNETEELSDIPFELEQDHLDCPVCHETFPNLVDLNMHMNEHYPNYTCNNCGKGFASKALLKRHLRTHQAGVFPCRYCDAVFDNIIKKQNHVSKEHKSGDVLCEKCNISLPSFYARQKHLVQVHHENVKRYKCKACTQSYITPGHLSIHVRRDHLNEKEPEVH